MQDLEPPPGSETRVRGQRRKKLLRMDTLFAFEGAERAPPVDGTDVPILEVDWISSKNLITNAPKRTSRKKLRDEQETKLPQVRVPPNSKPQPSSRLPSVQQAPTTFFSPSLDLSDFKSFLKKRAGEVPRYSAEHASATKTLRSYEHSEKQWNQVARFERLHQQRYQNSMVNAAKLVGEVVPEQDSEKSTKKKPQKSLFLPMIPSSKPKPYALSQVHNIKAQNHLHDLRMWNR